MKTMLNLKLVKIDPKKSSCFVNLNPWHIQYVLFYVQNFIFEHSIVNSFWKMFEQIFVCLLFAKSFCFNARLIYLCLNLGSREVTNTVHLLSTKIFCQWIFTKIFFSHVKTSIFVNSWNKHIVETTHKNAKCTHIFFNHILSGHILLVFL